jgi:hypothetical protein
MSWTCQPAGKLLADSAGAAMRQDCPAALRQRHALRYFNG